MTRSAGFTIIQLMVVLFIAGIAGWAIVNAVIDKRCETDPSGALCAHRAGSRGR